LNLRIFDELFTAPRAGFKSREDYYKLSSAKPSLSKIRLPTQILGAQDDPIIPPSTFENIILSPETSLRMETRGGHLGFIGHHKTAHGDRRWMDEFVLNWIQTFLVIDHDSRT
jgi:predicted alpha/beta-fold hydrolase